MSKISAATAKLLITQRPGNMKQYEDNGTSAPKIAANQTDKKEKDLERRFRTLSDQVVAQQQLIDRMHRDIVRLRTAINEVSARIK